MGEGVHGNESKKYKWGKRTLYKKKKKRNEYFCKEKLNQFLSTKKIHKVGVLTKELFAGNLLEAHF